MLAVSLQTFLPLGLAVAGAVIITAGIGALLELSLISWLKDSSVLRLIIITIGASILLREMMSYIWGIEQVALPHFSGTEGSSLSLWGAGISPQDLWVIGISALLVVSLNLFFKYTLIGRAMRACAANQEAARLCGINVKWMITLSFMISAAIGALAGCAISPLTHTQYDMGAPLAIKGFTVAILGGLGNSMAAVLAGILLGLLESFSVSLLPNTYRDAVSIAVLLLILFIKPRGLLGKAEEGVLKEF
jgi:branched-chain amino acid transport system permease protein